MSPAISAAIARLAYAAWSASDAGLPESPYPRRSATTTVRDSASAGATSCHITWVCGYPCNSRTDGPSPPARAWMRMPSTSTSTVSKPSNMAPAYQLKTSRCVPSARALCRSAIRLGSDALTETTGLEPPRGTRESRRWRRAQMVQEVRIYSSRRTAAASSPRESPLLIPDSFTGNTPVSPRSPIR